MVKDLIWKAHDELTLYPGGPKCCIAYLCSVLDVSPNFVYYQGTTGTKTVTNQSRSKANVYIMAWFKSLLLGSLHPTGQLLLREQEYICGCVLYVAGGARCFREDRHRIPACGTYRK